MSSTPSPSNSNTPPHDNNSKDTYTVTLPHPWEAYQDDEGRTYYYNTLTNETTWEVPNAEDASSAIAAAENENENANGITNHLAFKQKSQQDDDDDGELLSTGEVDAVDALGWVAYKDDEGRTYYYNTVTEVTQWEKPDEFGDDHSHQGEGGEEAKDLFHMKENDDELDLEGKPASSATLIENISKSEMVDDAKIETSEIIRKGEYDVIEQNEMLLVSGQEEMNEEEKKELAVKDAVEKLSEPDMLLEPDCLSNVSNLVSILGGSEGGIKAVNCLTEGFEGQTGLCAIMGTWLKDLQSVANSNDIDVTNDTSTEFVCDLASVVIEEIVKEKFTSSKGDAILSLSKTSVKFLQDMMASRRWRRLLIDLYADHKESALLMYCLQIISKKGFHREISSRVNQSDHFGVFNSMLVSELEIAASLSEYQSCDGFLSQVRDLRRMCASTSYTYLYTSELLKQLVLFSSLQIKNGEKKSDVLQVCTKRWTRLLEELEDEMLSSSNSNVSHMASLLTKKRRVDVTLAISDLRNKRARKHEHDKGEYEQKVNERVLSIMRKDAIGMKLEVFDLPDIQTTSPSEKAYIGEVLAFHPTAITALLGGLFKPGSARIRSDDLRESVSKLIALTVIASTNMISSKNNHAIGEELLQRVHKDILAASKLCESIENMVSFTVTEEPDKDDMSVGNKLCLLCNKSSIIACGVVMWARELANGSEFVASASYATLTPSILSIARLIAKRHQYVRSFVLELAMIFLNHKFASSREISYQQSKALKEQCIRLLIWLIALGEAPSTFSAMTNVLEEEEGSVLDASLIRYFVIACLEIIPIKTTDEHKLKSLPLIVSMSKFLCTKACVEALMTNYFELQNRKKLSLLIHTFTSVGSNEIDFRGSKHSVLKLAEVYNQLS